jgi:hypothetical protein
MTVMLVPRVLSFAPLLLPYIVPESWGTVHTHPHNAHSAYTTIFKTISIISTLMHGKSTLLALLFNTPDSHYHRHSLLHPFKKDHRSLIERTATGVGRILGAIDDHPAVNAVGWDVIISGLSVGLWATNRGLDVRALLRSSGLWFGGKPKAVIDTVANSKSITEEIEHVVAKSIDR